MRMPFSNPAIDRRVTLICGAHLRIDSNEQFSSPSAIASLNQQHGIQPQECRYICYPKLDGGFECSMTCTF